MAREGDPYYKDWSVIMEKKTAKVMTVRKPALSHEEVAQRYVTQSLDPITNSAEGGRRFERRSTLANMDMEMKRMMKSTSSKIPVNQISSQEKAQEYAFGKGDERNVLGISPLLFRKKDGNQPLQY